jgi:hypothetical protein
MPEPTNNDRAQWAAQALRNFSTTPEHCGDLLASPEEIAPEDVTDLLADLMHLCRRRRLDFAELLESARMNFSAEIAGEMEVARCCV